MILSIALWFKAYNCFSTMSCYDRVYNQILKLWLKQWARLNRTRIIHMSIHKD